MGYEYTHAAEGSSTTLCGKNASEVTTDDPHVNCPKCLAALAAKYNN